MNSSDSQLNELIEITRDGQHFYQHAMTEVKDTQMQQLFREMAETKAEVIRALSARVAADQAQPSMGGTLMGKLREAYADTRARFAKDEAAVYVSQLEAAEDRILHAFEDALESGEPEVRNLVAAEMPKVRACHDRMWALKKTLH